MEDSSGGSALRDDRSDSGVSSLRSAGSGDERSGSRSSALSPTPPPTQPAQPSRKIAENWRDSGSGMSGGGPGYPAPGLLIPPPPPLYTTLPPELWPPPQPKPPPPPAAAIRYTPNSADIYHDRIIRERREQEAHKEREKEREKQERERQERLEKQRAAEQAVHKHFEESLRLAQQKSQETYLTTSHFNEVIREVHIIMDGERHKLTNRASMGWINTLPAPTPTRADEKQQQQQQQQQHQQQLQQVQQQHQQQQEARMLERMREQRTPYHYQSRIKVDYPPPAHSRGPAQQPKQQPEKPAPLPKAEPNFNLFGGYPSAYQPAQIAFLHHDKKQEQKPALIVTKAEDSVKNTVIVKNDKSPGLHPPSPKLRDAYMPPKSPYEYRSPSQSPHPGAYEAQNLATISKVHTMHRPQHLSPHQRQSPHNHHRQSPHQHHRQSPLQHHPPSPHLHPSPPTVVYTKQATVGSYPYPSPTLHFAPAPPTTPPKPKVSSPAPQVYTKPRPLSRSGEVSKTLTPSPYQQVSQHNLPPPAQVLQQTGLPSPPAAHGAAKGYGLAVKQPPASPPGPGLALTPAFQTQPLDLGVGARETSSPKRKSEEESPPPSVPSPKRVKTEEEPVVVRTSESSPLPCITTQGRESPRPVHKLKKAWLQRHSGEDTTNSKDELKGGGVCVTLPMLVTPSTTPIVQPAVSIHSIGSMAVNSIKKPKQSRKPKELNGHVPAKSPENDDSSSSDPERKATPQKRVPPKVKRKKGGRKSVPEEAKRKKTSVSSTDSEKESGSDKESDTNSTAGSGERAAAGKKKEEKKEVTAGGKKRGRRPKTSQSKNGNEDESRKSKASSNNSTPGTEESSGAPQRDCIQKPSVGHLKKTGESFLQDGPCFEVAPKLAKCRECRWTPNQRNRNMPNIFCRFYAFRRLRYTKNGQLAIAGFSDPHRDALQDDLKLWLPGTAPAGLDEDMSKFLLAQLGDQFCDLLQQEKDAISIHMSDDKTIAWKRVVQGVREMCDVCETTLFNFHWACGKCGFVVCIDCYKGRKNGGIKIWGEPGRDRDDVSWLLCTNRQAHEQEKLMLTQIIAGDSLSAMGRGVHESRARLKIPQRCSCEVALTYNNGTAKDQNGIKKENEDSNSPLSWLADVALSEDKKSASSEDVGGGGSKDEDDKDSSYSTLRELLIRPSGKSNGSRSASPVSTTGAGKRCSPPPLDTLDQVISSVIDKVVVKEENGAGGCSELKHFIRRHKQLSSESLPARVMTMVESASMYPNVPHSWLCEGRLLRLLDSKSPKNYLAFQDVWKRGQPVMISDVTKDMEAELWSPESFQKDFGDSKNDLVDCTTGNTIPNQPMRKFWEGFAYMSKRLKDDDGQPMILKLKDWPPGEDFAEMLPSRFSDLMKVLPMGEYTQRGGRLNLASRLPDCFVRPDLGPKMYTAYGSAKAGTTNLHLDISDAVNVMVHVGIPSDVDVDQVSKEAVRAIDEAGCDALTRRRVREKGQLPGALWHIYMARDADKIRDLLNKVALERGTILEPHHDPIHDQSWYLDAELRDRLYKEYAVEGYSIVQCLGDAVFIPAGAPHQVRNLHNCIKVAEDFVSPENVSHCFHLTQEFRELTETHTNHEDKLQIKNIVYHAVKDSLAVLSSLTADSPLNGVLDR